VEYRALGRDDVERVWTIDRSERIERSYRYAGGRLHLEPLVVDVPGFPESTLTTMTPQLYACVDGGGVLYGAFDGGALVGAAALGTARVGTRRDLLQLLILFVSRAYRGQGIGATLFDQALADALARGARGLYVSATPTENTVHFYQGRGCTLADVPDPTLFADEPEDIHFERIG
jgi:GNAT superfamily N-acetyltransferase